MQAWLRFSKGKGSETPILKLLAPCDPKVGVANHSIWLQKNNNLLMFIDEFQVSKELLYCIGCCLSKQMSHLKLRRRPTGGKSAVFFVQKPVAIEQEEGSTIYEDCCHQVRSDMSNLAPPLGPPPTDLVLPGCTLSEQNIVDEKCITVRQGKVEKTI